MNQVEPPSYTVSCPYRPDVPTNGCNNPVITNTDTTAKSLTVPAGEGVDSDVVGATPTATPTAAPMYIWTSPGTRVTP